MDITIRRVGSLRAQLSGTALATMIALPLTAAAQSSGPVSAKSQESSAEIEEVLVTAQKRTENAQDVPKLVSVVSQSQLTDAGITRITDLQNIFPSVSATDQWQNTKNPGIRGIAPIANSIGVQSQVGIIVDDIPQATFSTLAFELTDLERVEVFPGPQSTLSGRNAASGIMNFVTRAPSAESAYEFHVEQTDDAQTRVNAFMTGALSPTLDYSVSLLLNQWSGNLRNVVLHNERLNGFDTKGGRVKLKWTLSDKLTASASAYYLASDREQPAYLSGIAAVAGSPSEFFVFDTLRRPASTLYPGIKIAPYNTATYSPANSTAKTRDQGGTFRLDYDVGDAGTFSSLTSYTYSNQPRVDVFIGTPRDNLVLNVTDFDATTDVKSKYYTQELRLTSSDKGPLTYLLGGIYTHTKVDQPYSRLQVFHVDWDRGSTIASAALFGQATYAFTPADSLTAGLRFQHDKIGYTWLFKDANIFSQGQDSAGFASKEASYKHKFGESVNAYVTYARSQTGKAYDTEDDRAAQVATLDPLPSQHVSSWAAGIKSELFDRRLTLNLDTFRTSYSNYYVQTLIGGSITSVPVIKVRAIGKVRTQGLEMSGRARPTDGLSIDFAAAYTDSKILSFPGAGCYANQTVAQGCVNGAQGDLAGLQLAYSTKWKANIGATYTIPMGNSEFDLGAFYRWQSTMHFDVLGDPNTYQKGFGVLNLLAGPSFNEGKIDVRLFVNNVFNKHYYSRLATNTLFAGPSSLVSANYARDSFRYAGVRVGMKF